LTNRCTYIDHIWTSFENQITTFGLKTTKS
jgi:hypothetical protein